MSTNTRTHRPTSSSPRYTKARGIGLDQVYWPCSSGTLRHDPPKEPFRSRRARRRAWAKAQKAGA